LQQHKNSVATYQNLLREYNDLDLLREYSEQGEITPEEVDAQYAKLTDLLEQTEFKCALDQPEDHMSCVLNINSGAGGTEADDWASMLLRMYLMWADKEGYKTRELYYRDGDVAGIKSVSIEIDGEYAYGNLKSENGVHRLVRPSPFNAKNKRQTSFASVFVYPLIDDSITVEINIADLSWDTFRSSGAGGQHVNKTESAVRVKHEPTGIVVECQEERSQHQNREKALTLLKSRIYELEVRKRQEERDALEATKKRVEWGSQIRSYVLDDRRIKDHRTGYETSDIRSVLDGNINNFLKAFLLHNNAAAEYTHDADDDTSYNE
jgi:peptide chain release factor 2